jgi:hypothetical protein
LRCSSRSNSLIRRRFLPGVCRSASPRLAKPDDRGLLPCLQLRRIQPLLAAPAAA